MAGLLAEFLRRSAGRPFVWGELDCYWWGVEWVELVRGSFSSGLRDKYKWNSARSSLTTARKHGGVLALYDELAKTAGLPRASFFRKGDVVIIKHSWRGRYMLAIYLNEQQVAVKTKTGVAVISSRPIVRGWNI